jgi:DNA recombination protein RmuC
LARPHAARAGGAGELTMLEIALLIAGMGMGAGGAWLVARGHFRAGAAAEREALGSRLAAAETLADETRKQLTQRELDVAELREALNVERTQRSAADVRWEEARRAADAQRQVLDEARESLGKTFEALSAEALRRSNSSFLELARQALEAQLGPREQAIKGLVQPLTDTLTRYETHLRELETARQHAYGSLEAQLRALTVTSEQLQRETGTLATALSRSSQARGRYGEVALRRIVELAGMTSRCDFNEQVSAEGGRARPDVVVHLPDRRQIVIDAKVPLAAYFDALAATRAEDRQTALARHAQQLRMHVTQLASKTYWDAFPEACDFVVMFVPGESFFAAAIETDDALIDEAGQRRVVIATPTSLIGLLFAIHHGWRQAQMAESAKGIADLGRDLYDRLRTMGAHFDKVRRGLVQATEAYNATVGSLQRRVLPAARRFEELGVVAGERLAELDTIDKQPDAVTAPELLTQETLPELGEGNARESPG